MGRHKKQESIRISLDAYEVMRRAVALGIDDTKIKLASYYYGVYCMSAILDTHIDWYRKEEDTEYNNKDMTRAIMIEGNLCDGDELLLEGNLDSIWERAQELYDKFVKWDKTQIATTSELTAMERYIEKNYLSVLGTGWVK